MLKNNILRTISVVFCLVSAIHSFGKDFTIKILRNEWGSDVKFYMSPMKPGAEYKSKALKPVADNQYSAEIPLSPNGLYHLVAVRNDAQLFTVVYYPCEQKNEIVEVDIVKGALRVEDCDENIMLADYTAVSSDNGRALWNTSSFDNEKFYGILRNYIQAADSLLASGEAVPVVKEYIKLWAYTSAYNGMHSAVRVAKSEKKQLLFSGSDVLGDYGNLFDCKMATLIPDTNIIIAEELPIDTVLIAKFDCLYSKYTNKYVLESVSASLISKFMARHDFSNDFDGGLAQLQAVVDKYNLNKAYITEYEKRRATIKGAPFPKEVVLRDEQGNVVDFSKFRGKYVYIDMWASWCVPCVKEAPHLQQLEKDLQNPNVVFVSISIDKNEDAWKAKMQELGLHGHQLIDKENRLYQALNPRGVPFFAIYDKEGRLYMHDAPRPSMGIGVKEMLEGLK